jgi:hypothetical protein
MIRLREHLGSQGLRFADGAGNAEHELSAHG